MNSYLLQVHYAPDEMCIGWDRAHHFPIVAEYDVELPERTGDDWADDVQAERGCPDEPALLWLYGPTGNWDYQVTIEGDPAGLRRCTRHAH